MDVFDLGTHPGYGRLNLANSEDRERFAFGHEPQREHWVPVNIVQVKKGPGRRKLDPLGDLAYFSPTDYAISSRALEVLEPGVGNSAEFLELALPDGQRMFGVHVLDCADDAVDEANTTFARREDGSIQRIREPAFLANRLRDRTLFALTHLPGIFVTEKILQLIESSGLKGFSFVRYPAR